MSKVKTNEYFCGRGLAASGVVVEVGWTLEW